MIIFGREGKLYYSAGAINSPTWVEISRVRDVTTTNAGTEVDLTTRASGGVKQYGVALIDIPVEFDMVVDPSDATYVALKAAFANKTVFGFAACTGGILVGGTKGWKYDAIVTQATRSEPLAGQMTEKFTVKPAYSANAPTAIAV